MEMHQRIQQAALDFEAAGKGKAANVYLGKSEMDALMKWATANYPYASRDRVTGGDRPEVHGLFVYEVNDSSHFALA